MDSHAACERGDLVDGAGLLERLRVNPIKHHSTVQDHDVHWPAARLAPSLRRRLRAARNHRPLPNAHAQVHTR